MNIIDALVPRPADAAATFSIVLSRWAAGDLSAEDRLALLGAVHALGVDKARLVEYRAAAVELAQVETQLVGVDLRAMRKAAQVAAELRATGRADQNTRITLASLAGAEALTAKRRDLLNRFPLLYSPPSAHTANDHAIHPRP